MPKKIKEEDFLQKVLMLETVEFVGVARILGVKLVEKKEEELINRDFEVVLNDMLSKYGMLSRRQRKNLMALLNAATKGEDND